MALTNNSIASISGALLSLLILCAAGIAQQPRSKQATGRMQRSSAVQPAAIQLAPSVLSHDYDETLAPGATASILQSQGTFVGEQWEHSQADLHSLGCDSCGMATQCCCNPIGALFDWSRVDLWVGVTSFNGAANFMSSGSPGSPGEVEGNVGFQQGFNFGSRVPSLLSGQVGSQLGMRFTHTNLDGSGAGDDNRTQMFLTAGLFRRVDYGLQGGLVIDYLHDDWLYKSDLVQLRGELSYLFSPCHDFGFRFTDSQRVDESEVRVRGATALQNIRLSGLNNYRFFYRYRFSERGRGLAELQAGFTEDSGAVLGVSLKTPLQGQLGLETSAVYLLPPSDAAVPYRDEAWSMGMAIVWTPGRIFGTGRDYYRPLMDVADNGSFLVRHSR